MSFFKKDELKILWPFYIDALFINILFIYPAFYILYMRDIGLSLTQIGFLVSSMSLAGVIFEIPTGAIADIFGRKFSTILGTFTTGVLIISTFFFKSFYSLLILFFLWGVAQTLISGAGKAWIVDLIKYKKKKRINPRVFYQKTQFF